ncbi:hypothetical protein, partial [Haloparvum sedimenti]|uniref:hypothetical protein n=1 Tax=Haloparvum sedimenti TaxID=1678448 RepID=UPI001C4005F6
WETLWEYRFAVCPFILILIHWRAAVLCDAERCGVGSYEELFELDSGRAVPFGTHRHPVRP